MKGINLKQLEDEIKKLRGFKHLDTEIMITGVSSIVSDRKLFVQVTVDYFEDGFPVRRIINLNEQATEVSNKR